ncbi:MAG: hypothetical protein SFY81_07545, partial [Verrucomicrobiota bacterium]|nr:hypothetical protein [Verrucomicrobiota bacterium]
MGEEKPKRFWRTCRITFRYFRLLSWLLLLLVVAALYHLNTSGVPNFIKKQALAQLRSTGLDIQFGNLRLDGISRLVVERLTLRMEGSSNAPTLLFNAQEGEVQFKPAELRKGTFLVQGLRLEDGRITVALPETNEVSRLTIRDVQGELFFGKPDRILVQNLQGIVFGVALRVDAA